MKKQLLFLFFLVLYCSCNDEVKFEQIDFHRDYSLKENQAEDDEFGYSYDASIIWSEGGTPEFKQWLANSTGIPNALTKSALLDSLDADAQRKNKEYRDFFADEEWEQSWSISHYSRPLYNCPDFVSIETSTSIMEGGLHPQTSSALQTWYLKENRVITKEDVFIPSKENIVLPLIMKELMNYWDCKSIDEVDDILDNGPLSIINFALVQDSIDFFYPYYTIAPYAFGQPSVRLAARDIAPALTDLAKRLLHVEEEISHSVNTKVFAQKKRQYSPLYLYYNPLDPNITGIMANEEYAPVFSYPNYRNYPNDWLKHGLRGNVSSVSYFYPQTEFTMVEIRFNQEGKIVYTGGYLDRSRRFAETREFVYDDKGLLTGILYNTYRDQAISRQNFEYDNYGKLQQRIGTSIGRGSGSVSYNYYADGTLKEVIPIAGRYKDEDIQGWKMEFNELGELSLLEIPETNNPFILNVKNDRNDLLSSSSFTYSNGLCVQKQEMIHLKIENKDIETIPCNSEFTYNDQGDLISWAYTGGVCRRSSSEYFIEQAIFTIQFEYIYDQYGNWTTMKIVLPDNFTDFQCLHWLYALKTNHEYPNPGERPEIVIKRELNYYSPSEY